MQIILIFILSILNFQEYNCTQTVELDELLKNHSKYNNTSICVTLTGADVLVSNNKNWKVHSTKNQCFEEFYLGNIKEIDSPNRITDYLKENSFEIDFVSSKTDDYGNIYSYFKFEDSFWKADFSCGSHGCGVYFKKSRALSYFF